MRRERITITIDKNLLKKLDQIIKQKKAANRSQAIEKIVSEYFRNQIDSAVILAGGKGKNLRPITYELPKTLLPVKGKPILWYILNSLKNAGIRNIYVCTNEQGKKIQETFKDGKELDLKIDYLFEKKPLLTGGAIKKLKDKLKTPFIVFYGDILTNLNLKSLIEFHFQNNALATVVVSPTDNPKRFGQLRLEGIKLETFYGKQKKGIKSSIVNTGVYVLNPEIFEYFPNKESFYLEDVIKELSKEGKVIGYLTSSQWFDIEDKEDYEEAIKNFQRAI